MPSEVVVRKRRAIEGFPALPGVSGQTLAGLKSIPLTDVTVTERGQETCVGMKPVLIRSSRVASKLGEMLTSQRLAPYCETQELQLPDHEP